MREYIMTNNEFILFADYILKHNCKSEKFLYDLLIEIIKDSKKHKACVIDEKSLSMGLAKSEILRSLFINKILCFKNEHLYFDNKIFPFYFKKQYPIDDLFFKIVELDHSTDFNAFKAALLIDATFEKNYNSQYKNNICFFSNEFYKLLEKESRQDSTDFNAFKALLFIDTTFEKNYNRQYKSNNKLLFTNVFCKLLEKESRQNITEYFNSIKGEYHYQQILKRQRLLCSFEDEDGTIHSGSESAERRSINPFNLKLSEIQKCSNAFESADKKIKETTFATDVINYCWMQGITRGVDFENETSINQNIYSKLITNVHTIPNKRICISICVGLRLTLDESRLLLEKAGYTLSKYIPFDKFVIDNSLSPKFYDIQALNNAIDSINEKAGYIVIKEKLGSIERGSYSHSDK